MLHLTPTEVFPVFTMSESECNAWFEQHLAPHEPMLRAWLSSRFSHLPEIDDIIQEAYCQVLAARARGTVMQSPKAFLFATARNRALDMVRARAVWRTEDLAEVDALAVLDENEGIPEAVARNQEIELLTRAIQMLPDRCRQVLTLRRIYGLSQKEVAACLGISEHTVEHQVAIGVRKCTEFLARYWEK